jgi:hypothetical protein
VHFERVASFDIVVQENGINVVHIESRRSRRANSEYEIYVDLEADRKRIEQSMQQLKRQVSCVQFDMNNLGEIVEALDERNNVIEPVDVPPASPFLDKNGQPIRRQSKSSRLAADGERQSSSDHALSR